MPKAYSEDVRWLVVYKRRVVGHSEAAVTASLEGVCSSTQDSILARFDETGTVETWQGTVRSGHLEPPNRKMSAAAEQALLLKLLHCPSATLQEHQANLVLSTGTRVHVSTICRALRELGYTRQRVSRCPAHAAPALGVGGRWCWPLAVTAPPAAAPLAAAARGAAARRGGGQALVEQLHAVARPRRRHLPRRDGKELVGAPAVRAVPRAALTATAVSGPRGAQGDGCGLGERAAARVWRCVGRACV